MKFNLKNLKEKITNRKSDNKLFRTVPSFNEYVEKATEFVNNANLSSTTNYLIWVDLKNFKTNIFQGSKNNWKLTNSFLCAIGKPSTPTIKGTFKVGIKSLCFGVEKGYQCWYYTQIHENYLFHSILYNLNGSIKDGRLGVAVSNGCVRLATDNAKWIWDHVPKNSTIYIS